MLVHLGDMLRHAYANQYAVGAFDLVSLDFLQAILAGAERQNAPVILSLAESHYAYFDPELLMPAVRLGGRARQGPGGHPPGPRQLPGGGRPWHPPGLQRGHGGRLHPAPGGEHRPHPGGGGDGPCLRRPRGG